MKKSFLISVLALALIFPALVVTAELLNITTAGVDGNWVIYDKDKNIIATWDAANRNITIPSGSKIAVAAVGGLQIGGANVGVATIADVTATADEINVLTSVTAGTAAANSAVVLDGSKNIAGIGAINGASVGIGAGNFSTITTASVVASGADIGSANFTSIKIGGANVVAAANDISAIASMMNENSTISLSAGNLPTQVATFQAKDATGTAITSAQFVRLYIADDANCTTLATAAANNTTTISGAGNLLTNIGAANVNFEVLTNAAGAANLKLDNTGGAANYAKYVCAVLPNRKIVKSAVTNVTH